MDPSRCIVLVPVFDHIERACEKALQQLERRGYRVRRSFGAAAIDQARSQLATEALTEGFDELMWIDADTGFEPDAVERLRAHNLPLVGGVCVKKNARALACDVLPGTERFVLGEGGGLTEVRYVGTGFLHTRREVYEKITAHEDLPLCNVRFGTPVVPFFLPMLLPEDDGNHWYLGEDYAFIERARRSGFQVLVDTSFRLEHIGSYGYTWEDAGNDKDRYGSYIFKFQ
ncbi:hypothetical protein HGA13_28420 [Nocardia speluncae]|uniref:Glycosyl transferase family 2 n=1 Tax=Nocardia speluncae TaxID=419477 RepID=A0A846XR37_9NOCA|nr:hypothetical protein [Nocardia speluncae]NKY36963.1 hypothetical protein [Nocardia speluncae]